MMFRTGAFAVLILCGVLSGPMASAASADRVDFSGSWQLDKNLSEDPLAEMGDAMEERRRAMEMAGEQGGLGGGMAGGGTGTGGGMGSGRVPVDDTLERERMERRLDELGKRLQEMSVTHEDDKLTVRYADGHERILFTDGKKHYRESGIGDLETRTKWKGNREIVVKATLEDGRKITETWELGPDGGSLHVKTSMKGRGGEPSFDFKRVYKPAPPE